MLLGFIVAPIWCATIVRMSNTVHQKVAWRAWRPVGGAKTACEAWHGFCTVPVGAEPVRFTRPQDKAMETKQGSLHCDMYVMKIITAIVRPFKLDEMRHAIAQLGVQGVTVTEVYEAEYGPRAKVEIAVDDSIVEPVLEAIANISRTGRNGDGTILVGNLEQAIRIRTGETGTAAT
jgi:nitrogen regulatory protein P-II 2